MAVSLSPFAGAGWQFFDNNGVILSGGKLYVYAAGTTSSATTYTSSTGLTANTNPIILNSSGRLANEIWLTTGLNYKFILKDTNDVLIGTWDNIPAGTTDVADLQAALASSTGAGMIGYIQGSANAVATTVQAKLRETVSVKDFGAVLNGVTDDAQKIQNAINANPGKRIVIDGVAFVSFPPDVSGNDTELVFFGNGGLTYNVATNKGLIISGSGCKISGGTITAPATWDGANVQPTYAVVWVTGNDCMIDGLTINNAPKVGIAFSDTIRGKVTRCTINGNYPSTSFTGTETGQAGIMIDPSGATGPQGQFIVDSNIINTCVQGVLIANYGAATYMQGINIVDNSFISIWNHGVYEAGSGGNGTAVVGNTFSYCGVPVALTGKYHVVSGNAIQTQSTGASPDVTGISMRDSIGCVVSNNSIKGDAGTNQIIINFTTSYGTEISGNIISNNSINVLNGSSTLINVGGTASSDIVKNNIITGNSCVGVGSGVSFGLIQIQSTGITSTQGNVISNNNVVIKGTTYGIYAIYMDDIVITGNNVRLEVDAGTSVSLYGIAYNNCTNSNINGNLIYCSSLWGLNVTLYAVGELNSGNGNRTSNNNPALNYTKLTSAAPFVGVNGSGLIVDEAGTGAPNLNAGVGSVWRRTNGGAGTTFYVKESGTGATGWVGK